MRTEKIQFIFGAQQHTREFHHVDDTQEFRPLLLYIFRTFRVKCRVYTTLFVFCVWFWLIDMSTRCCVSAFAAGYFVCEKVWACWSPAQRIRSLYFLHFIFHATNKWIFLLSISCSHFHANFNCLFEMDSFRGDSNTSISCWIIGCLKRKSRSIVLVVFFFFVFSTTMDLAQVAAAMERKLDSITCELCEHNTLGQYALLVNWECSLDAQHRQQQTPWSLP